MTSTIWMHGRTARIIIRDDNHNVIDLNDDWNNIASAQMAARDLYPEAKEKVVRDSARIAALDDEWECCKNGRG